MRHRSAHESRCRVTVTDKFGGRGHDFQVIDKESNANGGMLVIATSIPDEREWIQWKGRTARQDRPGQFIVVLNEKAKPFDDAKHKKLKERLRKLGDRPAGQREPAEENAKVELLLEISDEGIGEKLKAFELEQSQGEKLNELTERYYKSKPRGYDDPWPIEQHKETDSVLRKFLTSYVEKPPKEIVQLAKAELGIELEKEIRESIRSGASDAHVPALIKQVQAIPYTRSGKKVELAVRDLIAGTEPKNVGALQQADALDEYRKFGAEGL